MLGNFLCFCDLLTFFKINFLKKIGGVGGGGVEGEIMNDVKKYEKWPYQPKNKPYICV